MVVAAGPASLRATPRSLRPTEALRGDSQQEQFKKGQAFGKVFLKSSHGFGRKDGGSEQRVQRRDAELEAWGWQQVQECGCGRHTSCRCRVGLVLDSMELCYCWP